MLCPSAQLGAGAGAQEADNDNIFKQFEAFIAKVRASRAPCPLAADGGALTCGPVSSSALVVVIGD